MSFIVKTRQTNKKGTSNALMRLAKKNKLQGHTQNRLVMFFNIEIPQNCHQTQDRIYLTLL